MRKILVFVLAGWWLGCTQPEGYKIEVALEGAEGKIVLEKRIQGVFTPEDTAEFKNGKAIFKGKVDFPDVYILHLITNDQKSVLFVENTVIRVTGKADSLQQMKVMGSPVNDDYLAVRNQLENDNREVMAKYQEYQSVVQSGDKEKATQIMDEVKKRFDSMEKRIRTFVKENPSSWVAPLLLSQLQNSLSVEELDTLVSGLDPKLSVVPDVIEIKKQLGALKKTAVGQIAPDFTQNDPDGKPVKLSDVYSRYKYTLIDFWAAWCGPCRQENPNVVAVFNDFKAKGFTVFGVSLDQDRDRWLKAIADDKLDWTQVSDLKYWQNTAAALYAVKSIPANFLVDGSGKIVDRNLRGEDLRKKLAELLP